MCGCSFPILSLFPSFSFPDLTLLVPSFLLLSCCCCLFKSFYFPWPPARWRRKGHLPSSPKPNTATLWLLRIFHLWKNIGTTGAHLPVARRHEATACNECKRVIFKTFVSILPPAELHQTCQPESKHISSTTIPAHLKVRLRTTYIQITWDAHFKISILGSIVNPLRLDLWRWSQENCVFNKVFRWFSPTEELQNHPPPPVGTQDRCRSHTTTGLSISLLIVKIPAQVASFGSMRSTFPHICIPVVLAQTHFLCKPHTWLRSAIPSSQLLHLGTVHASHLCVSVPALPSAWIVPYLSKNTSS